MAKRKVVRIASLGRSVRSGIFVSVATLVLVVSLVALDNGGEDLGASIGGSIVMGIVIGSLLGAAHYVITRRRRYEYVIADRDEPALETAASVVDTWAVPVERCAHSAEAVARLRGSLPPSSASEWLAQITGTMTVKLADLRLLADAGRAAVPVVGVHDDAAAKKHPLYAVLLKAADEFAEVANEISKVVVELHSTVDLAEVKVQLQMLTEQLPLLRPAA